MKGSWNWKKFLALFMAIAMVMASGIFVTTQSFQATDDESFGQGQEDSTESVDVGEEESEEAVEETQEVSPEEDASESEEEIDTGDLVVGEESEEEASEDSEAENTVEEGPGDESSEESTSTDEGETTEGETTDAATTEGETTDATTTEGTTTDAAAAEGTTTDAAAADATADDGTAAAIAAAAAAAAVAADVAEPEEFKLTIRYVDEEDKALEHKNKDGELTTDDFTETLKKGEEYGIESPEIEGYALKDEDQKEVKGTMEADTEVVVTYVKVPSEEEIAAEEAAKKAEEEKAAAEAKKAEEEKAAAEAKKAEEEKAAAESKKAEEEKAAAEAKKAEEEAATAESKKAEEEAATAESKKAEDKKTEEAAAADANKADAAATEEVKTDAEGYLLDSEGKRVLDENGNPVKAETAETVEEVKTDAEGYLIDAEGNRILDADGNPIKADTEQAAGETNADEEGYLVDSEGKRVLDVDGNPIKADDPEAAEKVAAAAKKTELLKTYVPGSASGTAGELNVTASWNELVFPEGTTMSVRELSKEEAEAIAKEAGVELTEVAAVDITFKDADGNEVQPYENGKVNISFAKAEPFFGDDQKVLHVDEGGSVNEVNASTSTTGASFEAEEFSIYLFGSNGVANEFSYNNKITELKIDLYKDLTIVENVCKGTESDPTYIGGEWKITKNDNNIIAFEDGANTHPEDSKEPIKISLTKSGQPGNATVTYTYKANNIEYVDTYNIIITGYTIKFDLNGGNGTVEDQVITRDKAGNVAITLPSGDGLTRDGYVFEGWSTESNVISDADRHGWTIYEGKTPFYRAGEAYVLPADMCDSEYNAYYSGSHEKTIYAVWAPTENVYGKIGFYIRKDGVIQTEPAYYGTGNYTVLGWTKNAVDISDYIKVVKTECDVDKIDGMLTDYAKGLLALANEAHKEINGQYAYDPSQEVVWYVIKDQGSGDWHVDGIVGDSEKVWLYYNTNSASYTGQCPDSMQYEKNSTVTVGGHNTLVRQGYVFGGWNTKPDGTGIAYQEGDSLEITGDTTLYAQWLGSDDTPYTVKAIDADTGEEISNARKVRQGVTGNTIKVNDEDKVLSGYAFDEGNANNVVEATIKPDGSTTLVLYFRKGHTIDITMGSVAKPYDKEEVPVSVGSVKFDGADAEFELNNNVLTITAGGKTYAVNGLTYAITKNGVATTAKDVGNYVMSVTGTPNVTEGGSARSGITVEMHDGSVEIYKRAITLTSDSGEWEYDGKLHKAEKVTATWTNGGEGNPWLDGDEPTYRFTSKGVKAPGEVKNTFESIKDGTWETLYPNYAITVSEGTLKVTSGSAQYDITIQGKYIFHDYDGQVHKAGKADFEVKGASASTEKLSALESLGDLVTGTETVKFVIGDETYTITGLSTSGEGKDAGVYSFPVSGNVKIVDSDGADVTSVFNVNIKPGAIKINPAHVYLASDSLAKQYDGTELKNGDTPLKREEGWVEGEGATYSFDASIVNVGTTQNTFTYTLNENTKASNYTIEQPVYGSLEITNRDAKFEVTVTTNEGTYSYDKTTKEVTGFVGETADGIPVEAGGRTYYVTGLTAKASAVDAGTYEVAVEGTPVVLDGPKGNIVTGQFNVTTNKKQLVINKRNVTLTSASLLKDYDGSALQNPEGSLEVEEAGGIKVTTQGGVSGDGFAADEGVTVTFDASLKLPGTTSNTFEYVLNGNEANYNITKQPGTLTIRKPDAKFDITVNANSSSDATYDGNEHSVSGFVGQDKDGRIPVTIGDKTYYVSGLSYEVKGTDAGDYTGTVNGMPKVTDADGNDVTDMVNVTVVPGTMKIARAKVTIKSADLNKTYDGKPLVNGKTALATETGWVTGEGATYTFNGSQTLVGSSDNVYTYVLNANTKAENYDITTATGTLTVTTRGEGDQIALNIQANGGTFEFDNTPHTVSGFANSGENGIEVTYGGETYYITGLKSEATAKDATDGISTNVSGTPVVKDSNGNDVTAQFKVLPTAGKLVITKKDLVLKSASLEKEYDGTALTNGETALETESGWAAGDGATYSFTGSQTWVGNSANKFEVKANEGTNLANYNISKSEGVLTVKNRGAAYEITIKGKGDTTIAYDGKSHTVSGFEGEVDGRIPVDVDGVTYYVTGVTSTKTAKNVSESGQTEINGTPVVTDADGNDVSSQFAVKVEPGTLAINKRNVTLTSETRTKVYDGYPLTNGDGKITVGGDGLADGESLTYAFDASQTLIGQRDNTFTYQLAGAANAENYNFTPEYGQLVVTAKGGDGTSEGGRIDDADVVSKTHEDKVYKAGDTVDFDIEVTNVYAVAQTITITEQEGMTLDQGVFENVAGGAKVSTKAHHVVTEEDVLAGGFTNTVNVAFSGGNAGGSEGGEGTTGGGSEGGEGTTGGGSEGGEEGTTGGGSEGGEGTTPTPAPGGESFSAKDVVVTEKPEGAIAVFKTADVTGNVRIGDSVAYTIKVVNNGNVAVSGINVADELTGESWKIDTLGAGEEKEFKTSYKVTESDVANAGVTNVAKVSGTDGNGNKIEGSGNATVNVGQGFTLTIHYVDENGNPLSGDYVGTYQYRTTFHVDSPQVSGYTPTYKYVESGANGMPSQSVEVTVTYLKNADVINNNNNGSGAAGTGTGDNGGSGAAGTQTGDNGDSGAAGTGTTDNGGNGASGTGTSGDDTSDDDSSSSSSSGSSNRDNFVDRLRSTFGLATSTTTTTNATSTDASGDSASGQAQFDTSNDTDNSEGTNAGVNGDGTMMATQVRTPAVNNSTVEQSGISSPGAVISIGEDGYPQLVQADDTETPLAGLGLLHDELCGGCDIVPFICVILSLIVVIMHTNMMKKEQARIFDLRERLEELKRK